MHCHPIRKNVAHILFRNSINNPNDWEVGIVTSIFKKGDISNCCNYRGIKLLFFVLKVYKRIVEKRAKELLDELLE